MRGIRHRLQDVLEAIERIEQRTSGGRAVFDVDDLLQVWVLHHLQIIGEACRAIPQDVRSQFPNVPWSNVIGMRHVLVHHYFEIDKELVWKAVESELPRLKIAIAAALSKFEE